MAWRAMRAADLTAVERIAEVVHPAFPERPEVPRERLKLFPEGCFVARGTEVSGYAIAHPGHLGRPPALDTLLGSLPARPDCLYLHDIALLPAVRGLGLGTRLMGVLDRLGRQIGVAHISLIAVNGSAPYWGSHGFVPVLGAGTELLAKLASYGSDARYLMRPVPVR